MTEVRCMACTTVTLNPARTHRAGQLPTWVCRPCKRNGVRLSQQYISAVHSLTPADALTTDDRRLLVRYLHAYGLPDEHIARHTCMALYTTARIRDRLGLRPNQKETPV